MVNVIRPYLLANDGYGYSLVNRYFFTDMPYIKDWLKVPATGAVAQSVSPYIWECFKKYKWENIKILNIIGTSDSRVRL